MNRNAKRLSVRPWVLLAAAPWLAAALWLAPTAAETASVHLKDGTVMRGDVELTETEAIIRNELGQVRCARDQVDHVIWLEPPKTVQTDHMRRFWALAPDDVDGHFGLAQWLVERRVFEPARRQCAYVLKLDPKHHDAQLLLEKVEQQSATPGNEQPGGEDDAQQAAGDDVEQQDQTKAPRPKYKGVPPPPALSPRDILRLKLSEYDLDGPAERMIVRFVRQRGARDVVDLAREEMVNAFDYDPQWARTLDRGQPWEKLQVVLKATGLKYADRIEIRGQPRRFLTYRRRVLPLVKRSCVRSGCHGGHTARAFRFPTGSQSSDGFVYTSFLILDQIKTAVGPMIDRGLPEESALLRYMLPADQSRPAHPPVERGRVTPVLRGTRDPRYQAIVAWISSLRSPHPDYELEYQFPAWFEPLLQRQRGPLMLGEQPAQAVPEEQPAEDNAEPRQATSKPAADDTTRPDDRDGNNQP